MCAQDQLGCDALGGTALVCVCVCMYVCVCVCVTWDISVDLFVCARRISSDAMLWEGRPLCVCGWGCVCVCMYFKRMYSCKLDIHTIGT